MFLGIDAQIEIVKRNVAESDMGCEAKEVAKRILLNSVFSGVNYVLSMYCHNNEAISRVYAEVETWLTAKGFSLQSEVANEFVPSIILRQWAFPEA